MPILSRSHRLFNDVGVAHLFPAPVFVRRSSPLIRVIICVVLIGRECCRMVTGGRRNHIRMRRRRHVAGHVNRLFERPRRSAARHRAVDRLWRRRRHHSIHWLRRREWHSPKWTTHHRTSRTARTHRAHSRRRHSRTHHHMRRWHRTAHRRSHRPHHSGWQGTHHSRRRRTHHPRRWRTTHHARRRHHPRRSHTRTTHHVWRGTDHERPRSAFHQHHVRVNIHVAAGSADGRTAVLRTRLIWYHCAALATCNLEYIKSKK